MKQFKVTATPTPRDADSIEKYLTEVGHYDLLSAEQEVVLFQTLHMSEQHMMKYIER